MMLRIVLASRSARLVAVVPVLLALPGLALGNRGISIEMAPLRPANLLPYPELCGVLTAIVVTTLVRPRFWEWDRVGTRRAALVSGAAATSALVLPLLVMAVGATRVSEGAPWLWSLSNVLVYSAAVVGLAPFVGVGLAGGIVLVGYFGVGVLNNAEPAVGALLPVATYAEPTGNWVVAVGLAVLAVAAHVRTRGVTAWAHRLNP
ncbi:hypothetical protein ABZ816_20890 [Actinosynnema sp. NPDC047251]|nr:hypothetical protein [Saccharothrix espanaensis]